MPHPLGSYGQHSTPPMTTPAQAHGLCMQRLNFDTPTPAQLQSSVQRHAASLCQDQPPHAKQNKIQDCIKAHTDGSPGSPSGTARAPLAHVVSLCHHSAKALPKQWPIYHSHSTPWMLRKPQAAVMNSRSVVITHKLPSTAGVLM